MYGQPQYGAPQPSPYGYGAPAAYGQPGIAPPPQGMLRPPATFNGWFTMYYNMMQPHEVMEAQGETGSLHTVLKWFLLAASTGSGLAQRVLHARMARTFGREAKRMRWGLLCALSRFAHFALPSPAWFAAIDRDRSGSITANEIQQCTFANVPLGFDTAAKLVRVFDKNCTGNIDFFEYAAMHKFLSIMQHAFFSGDRDRTGRLDAVEIHTALGVGQLQVAFPAVQALYNKYNRDGYG